ncbi:MAG: DMT family transporter [Ruminococcaceae bacterium]|nr:DMT family transporter [Oscillospiraceae bacterium]
MISGIIAGATWALETVILGIALAMTPFVSDEQAIFLAPFVSTFLHDACSALWALLCNTLCGRLPDVWRTLTSKSGKWVVIAALIGGPVGMTGYVLAVSYMGAAVGAIASAIYPAVGSVLAYIFLKEKMKWYQWIFLIGTLLGVLGLSFTPDLSVESFGLGLLGALMCSFGWGIEAVILAKCLKDQDVKDECALQIRQTTSALCYGAVIFPLLGGWSFTADLFTADTAWLLPTVAIAALFATLSYTFYYKAIASIGASRAMALNVTYTAWAMIFTALLLGDFSVLSPMSVLCASIVLICGIFAATDLKKLFPSKL